MLKSTQINTNIKICKSLIRAIFMCAAETMSMTKKQEKEELRVVERKLIKLLMGQLKLSTVNLEEE